MKKAIALILSLVMMLSFTACGGTETADPVTETTPTVTSGTLSETATNDRIYTEKKLDLGSGVDMARSIFANGRIYYRTDTEVKNDDDVVIGTVTEIFSVNADGGDVKSHLTQELLITRDTSADVESYEYLPGFGVDGSGNLWLVVQTVIYDTSESGRNDYSFENTLIKLSPEGEELLSVDLSTLEGLSELYVTGIIFDGGGNAYISFFSGTSSSVSILVFSGETGEYLFRVEENGVIQSAVSNDGHVVYMVIGGGENSIVTLDAALGGVAAIVKYDASVIVNNVFNGFGEWSVTIFRNNRIYGLSFETMETAVIIDFELCGIDTADLSQIYPVSGDEFMMLKRPMAADSAEIIKLTYDPNAAAIEKVTVTLGVVAEDAVIVALAVDEFNKASETVRVEIVDYATLYNTESDKTQAVTRFDIDVLNGNAPDMLSLSGISANKYITKGVIADLTAYLDNDTMINRNHLYDHILDMGKSDGKLYHIIAGFGSYALVGKTSIFGDGSDFTPAKLNEIAARYPNAEIVCEHSAMEWLDLSTRVVLDDLIDWETGMCGFDSPDFIEMLKLLKRFPNVPASEIQHGVYYESDYYENYRDKLQNDKTLLLYAPISYSRVIKDCEEDFGEEVTVLGFPSSDGGGTVMWSVFDFGIMEGTENKDAAWEFISWLLQDGNSILDFVSIGSLNKYDFENKVKSEMVPYMERDFEEPVTYEKFTGMWMGGGAYVGAAPWSDDPLYEMLANYHLLQHDADRIFESVYAIKYPYSGEDHVMKIVSEEAEAFLNGVRSAEEAAKIIQSRVSIYVSENM